ncbi:MAG TPA: ClC family H(+)/Cl(-) exchange transporter [Lachnospiraceae bacterium]|nr:ClC family H(+)/Cl(-) exchange transporter [Lachnospiraceae bacterium]
MSSNNKHNTYNSLFHWKSFRLKLVTEGIAIGLMASLVVVLYRFALEKSLELVKRIYHVLSDNMQYLPIWILVLLIIGYIVGLLGKYIPMISGSGIPQVEGVLLRKLRMTWWKVVIGKFIGGVLAIGSGLSLGREGPSVQLGAAVGQGFSRVFKRIKLEEKFLITCGASAGLSAAFNAPLAGVMFALEEVHKNFSPLVLLSALSAALSADYISSGFFGLKPVLSFSGLTIIPLKFYLYIVILGIILGVFGVVFNRTILMTQNVYSKIRVPKEFWILIPLMVSVVCGLLLPEVLGGGHEIIISLLTASKISFLAIIIMLIVKFLFTMICYGSGAPGGIFLPLLSIGALIGGGYGVLLVQLNLLDSVYIKSFILLAMAGYFTAIVRAPITGIILITEMTGSFSHLLSLSIVSIIAYLVADVLGSKPIYESLLERILNKQGEITSSGNSKHKSILEFAVCMGSLLDGKEIKSIEWPCHCLLVAIRRGEHEIIPKGDTVISAGDYLVVLTNEDRVSRMNDTFTTMICSREK